jgi:hypothetical protein
VQVIQSPPELESITLHKVNGRWQADDLTALPETQATLELVTPTHTPAAPTPTLPQPTATAIELPADTLYYDDFSDPESGWDSYSELKISYGYTDDTYRIWINFGNTSYWFNPGESYSDVVIESQVTLRDGPNVNRFGLVCRYDEDDVSMVQFLIDGMSRYGILVQKQAEFTFLGSDGMQFSEAINPAGEPNLLRAVCDGDTLSLSVNGKELLTTQDTMSSGAGDIGIVVNTTGGAGLEVVYDYLLATEP